MGTACGMATLTRLQASPPSTDAPDRRRPAVAIEGRKLVACFAAGIVLLNVANLISLLPPVWKDGVGTRGWLLLDRENNPSTWFSAAMLATAGGLLMVIRAARPATERRWWLFLAVVMGAMSLDEVSTAHEQVQALMGRGDGWLYYTWVFPALMATAVVGVLAWRFLGRVSRPLRMRATVAAGVFLSGAIVTEVLGGFWTQEHGVANRTHFVRTTIEENLEMIGVLLFVAALARFAAEIRARVRIDVD